MFVQHKKYLWASMACSWSNFIFYMQMIFVLHMKHIYGPPRPVRGIQVGQRVKRVAVSDTTAGRIIYLWF
jgi:hypothetical protein